MSWAQCNGSSRRASEVESAAPARGLGVGNEQRRRKGGLKQFTETGKTERVAFPRPWNQESCFGHVEFEVPVVNPAEGIK